MNKNYVKIALIIALIGLSTWGAYTLLAPDSEKIENGVNYSEATEDQIKAGEEIKEDLITDSSIEGNDSEELPPAKQDSGTGSNEQSNNLQNSITVLEVQEGTLYVRNEIKGVYASGTCTLTLKNGSRTITKNSGIQALAQVSTCQGFNIATSELSQGAWDATLTVTINGQSATAKRTVDV